MVGGAIFTPLLNDRGHSIGLIRQYYYNKVGEFLSIEKQQEISQLFSYCTNTSKIFDNLK